MMRCVVSNGKMLMTLQIIQSLVDYLSPCHLLPAIKSLSTGVFHLNGSWPILVFKGKGISYYRSNSLLTLPSKLLDVLFIIASRVISSLNNLLSPRQFGFCPGSSTQEALYSMPPKVVTFTLIVHTVVSVFF